MKTTLFVALMLGMSVTVTGCGRSAKATTNVSTVSAGQQLTDLQKAYESGAITEKEYNKKREQILRDKN